MVQGCCPECDKPLTLYAAGHPAFDAVGQLEDWTCSSCNCEAGETAGQDQLYSCIDMEDCGPGICRTCYEAETKQQKKGVTVNPAAAVGDGNDDDDDDDDDGYNGDAHATDGNGALVAPGGPGGKRPGERSCCQRTVFVKFVIFNLTCLLMAGASIFYLIKHRILVS